MAVGEKKGRWYCHYRDLRGKGIREYYGRGDAGRRAAEARDLEVKLHKLQHPKQKTMADVDGVGAPIFQDLAQRYINHRCKELAAATQREIIRAAIQHAIPVMGYRRVTAIKMTDLTALEQHILDGGAGTATCNRYVGYISRIFSWALERQIIKTHPWQNRKPLKTRRHHIELPTIEEIRQIIYNADDHLRWAIQVEYNTGLRPGPSELFALKWSDIDLATGTIRVYSPKTDQVHYQYVHADFLEHLRQKKRELEEKRELCDYVISWRGERIKSLKRVWSAAKRRAGITRPLRMYDLRHAYASYSLALGAPILELAHRLGHVNSDMVVKVYAHLADGIRQRSALPLPELYPASKYLPAVIYPKP